VGVAPTRRPVASAYIGAAVELPSRGDGAIQPGPIRDPLAIGALRVRARRVDDAPPVVAESLDLDRYGRSAIREPVVHRHPASRRQVPAEVERDRPRVDRRLDHGEGRRARRRAARCRHPDRPGRGSCRHRRRSSAPVASSTSPSSWTAAGCCRALVTRGTRRGDPPRRRAPASSPATDARRARSRCGPAPRATSRPPARRPGTSVASAGSWC